MKESHSVYQFEKKISILSKSKQDWHKQAKQVAVIKLLSHNHFSLQTGIIADQTHNRRGKIMFIIPKPIITIRWVMAQWYL